MVELIPAAASIIGNLMNNKQSQDNAATANAFSAQQSATQYQRGTADMKAAGLNPMLAYSQGGAASATGVQAQTSNIFNGAQEAYNATKQTNSNIKKQTQETETSSATEAKINEEKLKVMEEKLNTIQERARIDSTTQNLKDENANIRKQLDVLIQNINTGKASERLNNSAADSEIAKVKGDIPAQQPWYLKWTESKASSAFQTMKNNPNLLTPSFKGK